MRVHHNRHNEQRKRERPRVVRYHL
ncbi:hypothetical protein D018_0451A, partial [Vibrio parahaemolyticus VP2007-007]